MGDNLGAKPLAAAAVGMSGELAITGLSKRFGQTQAVNDLSFRVQGGQILALLGPNGAGKTTTLLCIAGLVRPDAGTLTWNGQVVGPERGRLVALIPESPETYDMLTVWEHLAFVSRSCLIDGDWPQRANRLLERLGIADQRDTLGEALSKGMRQKILIACAVLARTPILLLDEPMIGLDPKGQRELRDILLELREQRIALVLSTHLLAYVDTLCDHLLIMKGGRRLASGPLDAILRERGGGNLEDIFLEITK